MPVPAKLMRELMQKYKQPLYHAGTYKKGELITQPLYMADTPEFARSYLDNRYPGAKMMALRPNISRPAPEDLLMALARKYVPENEQYTPASMFDESLHGEKDVWKLIMALRGKGYDSARAMDVPMDQSTPAQDVTIALPGTRAYARGGQA
jgi:hypothetical protein